MEQSTSYEALQKSVIGKLPEIQWRLYGDLQLTGGYVGYTLYLMSTGRVQVWRQGVKLVEFEQPEAAGIYEVTAKRLHAEAEAELARAFETGQ